MDWTNVDWTALEGLRERFLSESPSAGGDYWQSGALASYDFTFARRIGWKWDAVLEELGARGFRFPAGRPALLDWGCGTGVAARRVLAHFGKDTFASVHLFDRSATAMAFAEKAIREEAGVTSIEQGDSPPAGYVLLLSHVVNELEVPERLGPLVRGAAVTVWVEPGTFETSRKLVAFREALREGFRVVAPCTHQAACGMLAAGNERHWCHHFARPPAEVFRDAGWAQFSRRLGIDLRSLPVSYLVLAQDAAAAPAEPQARVIGRPRRYKGYTQFLSCDASGVSDRRILRKSNPRLHETLQEDAFARFVGEK